MSPLKGSAIVSVGGGSKSSSVGKKALGASPPAAEESSDEDDDDDDSDEDKKMPAKRNLFKPMARKAVCFEAFIFISFILFFFE